MQLDCSDLILNHAWINNQKTSSSDGRTFTVEDPADGTTLATLPDCGQVEAEAAVIAAHKAFSTWRALLAKERAQYLQSWLSEIRKHAEDLARLISLEEGKPLREARFEIEGWTAGFFEYFVDFGRAAYGEVLPSDNSQQLDDLAQKRYGKRVMDLAVRWVLDQPGVTSALWGARHPAQLEAVTGALDWNLDAEGRAAIDQILRQAIANPVGPEFMAPPEGSTAASA